MRSLPLAAKRHRGKGRGWGSLGKAQDVPIAVFDREIPQIPGLGNDASSASGAFASRRSQRYAATEVWARAVTRLMAARAMSMSSAVIP